MPPSPMPPSNETEELRHLARRCLTLNLWTLDDSDFEFLHSALDCDALSVRQRIRMHEIFRRHE